MLADTLREECVLYDIDVHCSFPGNMATPGFEIEQKTKPAVTQKMEGASTTEKPEDVAKWIIARLERGHHMITYDFVGTMLKVTAILAEIT
jgi:3-dehydrosphinganine reductase